MNRKPNLKYLRPEPDAMIAVSETKAQFNELAVAPGLVQRESPADPDAFAHRFSYLNRICTQDDVANVAMFLALPESDYVTGQNYVVDGGRSLGLKGDV